MVAAHERAKARKATLVDTLWTEPEKVFRTRGIDADEWQVRAMQQGIRSSLGMLLLCCRQAGKSQLDAAMILLTIMLMPPALVLVLSRTFRQAMELLKDKFMPMYEPWRKHCPMKRGEDNKLSKEFVNGSRIVVLPDEEGNVRAFSSVALIALDEASRVSDNLFRAVLPMLAVSHGRIIASTTAFGQRGFFYEEWKDPSRKWLRFEAKATDCKRLTPEFLADVRLKMGDRYYEQEYLNNFASAVGSVFSPEDIAASFGRVSEEEAWQDLFGSPESQPSETEGKTLEF